MTMPTTTGLRVGGSLRQGGRGSVEAERRHRRRKAAGACHAGGAVEVRSGGASVNAALILEGSVKKFGGAAAVDGVSLSVATGEVLALVGENGAGKSTLISVACGRYRADAGTVRAFGLELLPGDPRAAIEAGSGGG